MELISMSLLWLQIRHFLQDLPITLGLKRSAATFEGELPETISVDTLRLRHHSSGCGVTGVVRFDGTIKRLNFGARFYNAEGVVVTENSIMFFASEGTVANFSITSPSFDVSRAEVYWRGFGDLDPIRN